MLTDLFNREYFEWLCNLVDGFGTYYFLMKRLYSKPFYWSVHNDDNREADGMGLRRRYNEEHGYLEWSTQIVNGEVVNADLDAPCSVLEMMIALSLRCERDIMNDPSKGDRSAIWFWLMIQNLGLIELTDDKFDENFNEYIDNKIDILLERSYDRYGNGGLFPVKKEPNRYLRDQRKVEIWYQMCTWLNQNYN